MLLYKDVISGDELFTDTFTVKEVDDIAYEIDTKMVTIKKGADVDIGANPSAEEAQEESEEGTEQVNDLVAAMRLSATSFDKKSYMTYIKGYMKAVKNHLQQTNADRVPVFEKQVQGLVKKILGNFKDYEFYTGEVSHLSPVHRPVQLTSAIRAWILME